MPEHVKKPRFETAPELLAELQLLRDRLRSEGELELLNKLRPCQEPLVLRCLTCERKKQVVQRCKRKWCPCCAKQLASARTQELDFIVARMRWPLFVTLTMKNESELSSGAVRKLRRAFGKLRHRKLWKYATRGGIAAVEVTNIGNGWHPHLHVVIDCRWLAFKTREPRRGDTREEKIALFQAAAAELEAVWSKLLGQQTSSVKVKRADKATIAKEVLKYTVKNEDLVMCEGRVGDLIRALDSCRLMTTFGTAHGSTVKEIRAEAKAAAKAERAAYRELQSETDCCPDPVFMPDAGETTIAVAMARNRPVCVAA